MDKEESFVKIIEQPPPSKEDGFELVYSKSSEYEGSDFNVKASKTEKLRLIDLLTTPGLNIIIVSLLSGIGILLYLIYLILR